jgi:hypothetical protein
MFVLKLNEPFTIKRRTFKSLSTYWADQIGIDGVDFAVVVSVINVCEHDE